MELELRHLRTICAIAECGSVTRAARVSTAPDCGGSTPLEHSGGHRV